MKIMQIINAKGLPGIKGPSNGEAKKINADGIREEADGNHVRLKSCEILSAQGARTSKCTSGMAGQRYVVSISSILVYHFFAGIK